ncbi:hypothetical protein [Pseudoduganella violaceinigra]|uniref:hypothetical protein n=1 Tax=Pseudoduganella violaceinigra TaxID=246602 RepID=UPI0012B53817|nr:hypothetical protein [Pseudoduganella violaceinigra]
MQPPPNVDLFNRFCLAVFNELYTAFPVPVNLKVAALIADVTPEEASYEIAFNAHTLAAESLKFLESEGFLTSQGSYLDQSEILQVRLSLKGLTVLGMVPNSLTQKKSAISGITDVVAGGLKKAAAEKVQDLASQVFSYALVAAPSLVNLIVR